MWREGEDPAVPETRVTGKLKSTVGPDGLLLGGWQVCGSVAWFVSASGTAKAWIPAAVRSSGSLCRALFASELTILLRNLS